MNEINRNKTIANFPQLKVIGNITKSFIACLRESYFCSTRCQNQMELHKQCTEMSRAALHQISLLNSEKKILKYRKRRLMKRSKKLQSYEVSIQKIKTTIVICQHFLYLVLQLSCWEQELRLGVLGDSAAKDPGRGQLTSKSNITSGHCHFSVSIEEWAFEGSCHPQCLQHSSCSTAM